MKEQLINFSTAKLAKEKGFNIKCDLYYSKNGSIKNRPVKESRIEAPTQSLLQKWLRDVHDIHIVIFDEENQKLFWWEIYDLHKKGGSIEDNSDSPEHTTYEEALEKGLQEALNLPYYEKTLL